MEMEDIDLSAYPEGSICREMVIDIFVDTRSGEVSILHDRPFSAPVRALSFDAGRRRLAFLMDGGVVKDFGVEIKPDLSKALAVARNVALFEVDRQVTNLKHQAIVPLSQV